LGRGSSPGSFGDARHPPSFSAAGSFASARTAAYPEHMSDKRNSSVGEFIRRQRELSQVSMRQFAEMVGISNPYLSQIERGLRAPSEQVVQSIADALQVSADTLYDQAGVPREKDGPSKVVQAIREDPKLTGRQRQALIEVYEAFVVAGARLRRS
jgi:transcriptional regulator with XRE-family HTH domain